MANFEKEVMLNLFQHLPKREFTKKILIQVQDDRKILLKQTERTKRKFLDLSFGFEI